LQTNFQLITWNEKDKFKNTFWLEHENWNQSNDIAVFVSKGREELERKREKGVKHWRTVGTVVSLPSN
jgi:hypothetical protein